MEVNIYINAEHTGHLSKGNGKYAVTIESETSKGLATLQLYKGVLKTSRNRTALIACLDAFSHLKKPCFVNLYIDNTHVTETINQEWYKSWNLDTWTNKGKAVGNADLWKEFLEHYKKHKIKVICEGDTPYTSYMKTQIAHVNIEYKEDICQR
ncbi:RNase H family protein [Anaerocolumna chitinilytica]|uniref:RNase H type-1 domain-containing protein n=1 Tax=Anaerocolumna chitinilytica TaxID=1727145 RepID=A0A7M3SA18_9FIRM|nr:RNase H family protein [Anaerocolumna chitinilytica]BCK01436.1 hypothetical protein bsdcttw_44760 [Anaerocolumna chitinilytica]